MYRVAADRAVSYAYLIMMGSRRDGRNLPEVGQHLIEQSVDFRFFIVYTSFDVNCIFCFLLFSLT